MYMKLYKDLLSLLLSSTMSSITHYLHGLFTNDAARDCQVIICRQGNALALSGNFRGGSFMRNIYTDCVITKPKS